MIEWNDWRVFIIMGLVAWIAFAAGFICCVLFALWVEQLR